METLTIKQISELQKQYGLEQLQKDINSGECWMREGFYGRTAMRSLKDGATMLPEKRAQDYYGNVIPSRNDLKPGTKGSLLNAENFWQKVLDGEIEMNELEEEEEEEV